MVVKSVNAFEKAMTKSDTPILNELNLRLFVAVILGTKEEVSQVIAAGADVNALNLNRVSPLELAKAYQRKGVIKLLEEHGAQPAKIKPSKSS